MKKQNVTLVVEIDSVKIVLGSCVTEKKFKIDDVVALNPKLIRPIYFQVLEVLNEEIDGTTLAVRYFGGKKVLYRASIYNAPIVPLADLKPNYNAVVTSMLFSE
jgi:hypothetical protein